MYRHNYSTRHTFAVVTAAGCIPILIVFSATFLFTYCASVLDTEWLWSVSTILQGSFSYVLWATAIASPLLLLNGICGLVKKEGLRSSDPWLVAFAFLVLTSRTKNIADAETLEEMENFEQ